MTALAARLQPHLIRLAPAGDAALLARFVAGRDEAAFTELVRRNAPAVLAVCRRLTRHTHDAEDAFQAVFLVLARKADHVRPGEPVSAWLYGVAVRAARNAAVRGWRRRTREVLVAAVPDMPERPMEPFDPDAAAAVLDEVRRLPDRLRAAVVLCELDGRPRTAAARELGIAEGTLSSRLAAARKQLAARLAARGFAPAVLAVLSPAIVPRRLAAAAGLVTTGRVPPAVIILARGALPIMDVNRFLFVPLLVGLVVAVALATPPANPAVPQSLPATPLPRAAPPGKGPNQLFFCWGDNFYRCDPDGGNGHAVTHPACEKPHPRACSLSPDGKRVVYALNVANRDRNEFKLLVFAADGTGPATECGDYGDGRAILGFHWSGDGTRLLVSTANPKAEAIGTLDIRHEVIEVATRRRTGLPLPADHHLTDWSRDGERFIARQFTTAKDGTADSARTWILDRAGKIVREIVAPGKMRAEGGRFSPDGRRVLYDAHRPGDHGNTSVMLVLDLATGVSTPVDDVPRGGRPAGACWAPDGRRIAYTWQADRVEPKPGHLDPNQKIDQHVIVCDPDGRNKTVVATTRTTAGHWRFGTIEWR